MEETLTIPASPPIRLRATPEGIVIARGTFREQIAANRPKWIAFVLLLIPFAAAPLALMALGPHRPDAAVLRGCIGSLLFLFWAFVFACCSLVRSEISINAQTRTITRRKFSTVRAQTIPDGSSLLSVAYDKAPTPTDHRTVQLLVWDGNSSLRRILSISWDALRGITPQAAAADIANFLGAHLPGIPCQR